ncbi:MAG TPA: flippase [Terracidiphilus sp.]|jgi:O-antigen/teichoic acid export membrane protein
MSFLNAEIQRIRTSALAHNAGWMLIGQGINLILQTGYFILLARLLGVKEYGVFVGALALVSIATPYSALGSGLLFVRYVSSNAENFPSYWGNILISTLGGGSLITVGLYFVAPHLLNHESASLILLLALGECICRQLVICISQVFQAYEQLRMMATITLLSNFFRLIAVVALAFFLHRITAWQWALASLVVSAFAAMTGSAIVVARYGCPRIVPRLLLSRLGEGTGFAFAGSTQSAYNDIDKAMLSHYGMNVANGIYTFAYRIIDVATVPITALDAAALPRFFRRSSSGHVSVRTLSVRLALRAVLFGLLIGACMFLAAPLIPRIVGNGFRESAMALRWLCVIPAFRGMHQLTGGAITGLGFQRYRTIAQFFAAALNFGLNLWLIPRHGWAGAAWASVATDGALAAANWSILQSLRHGVLEDSAT